MNAKRIPNDAYYTPDWVTDRMIDNFSHLIDEDETILEPCCGTNNMVDRMTERMKNNITATDITMGSFFDASTSQYWDRHKNFDWVITNPPFNSAPKILFHALNNANKGVIFLLRLSFLEPCPTGKTARFDVLTMSEDSLRFVCPLNPRPKFRKDMKATDSVTSAWFVWDKRFSWSAHDLTTPFVFQ